MFDVQRGALHDGPGIRTTVFLKGCPLRCAWCHNPESQRRREELSYAADRCTDCMACVAACPHAAHVDLRGGHRLDRHRCKTCGLCVDACDHRALAVIGRMASVDEIIGLVARDAAFYVRSGGGITLSGGEPLAQPAFATALLSAAKSAGIHTCLDTCGYASAACLGDVIPVVDLFLYDYKATDPAQHRALTGVSNDRILANLDTLCAEGARLILRCPLVPGLNDSPSHLAAIAALSRSRREIEAVHVLPYHAMGDHKAERVGRRPRANHLTTATAEQSVAWIARLTSLGCRSVSLG